MKKVPAIMALLLCSGLAQARTYDEIINSGFLKVGVPADYAPLAFYNTQEKLVGFDIDMAKDLAKQLNVTPVFYITSWPTLSQDLADDNYDIAMGGVTYTKSRAEKFLLSDEIVPNGKVALAACHVESSLSSLDKIDKPNVKVVVNPGGTNESFVNDNIHTAQVIHVENNFDNIQALRDKTADLMVTDLIEGQYYQYKEPNVLCLATDTPFKGTESYKAYMVQSGNQKLLDAINSWLPNSNKQQLAIKWGVKTQLN
ncbi:transporter substrate-binding domain-containing protein [Gilliamella apicola]|uniref:transporter substrate-binding domain-containing protein n=1 Tax=Gilliamella apicola TaxID=1196095 RepID=UPI00080E82AE|nr:transporter substrate-binding domain-containing protein [Gilliamella apicola]OCG11923.1 amino acid ABC transporter substrate-binding protein [Gilliamella apicola]